MSKRVSNVSRLAILCLGATCFTASAPAVQADDEIQWSMTPYLWLPSMSATVNLEPSPAITGNANVESDPTDPLSNLKFGFMGLFQAKKGDWFVLSDISYLDVGDKAGKVVEISGPGPIVIPVDVGTKMQFQNSSASVAFGKTVAEDEKASIDVFAGVRWIGARVTVDYKLSATNAYVPVAQGSIEQDRDITNAIVGFRGKFRLSEDWYAHYYADAGAGSSDITYMGQVGVGYKTSIGDLQIAYRHMYAGEDNALFEKLEMSGFAIGLTSKF